MDYEQLYHHLPKTHFTWNISDTQVWLNFVGLQSLGNQFANQSVDGSVLSDLTEELLREELRISSRIVVKKLLAWITKGFQQFDHYVQGRQGDASSSFYVVPENTEMEIEESTALIKGNMAKRKSQKVPTDSKKPRQLIDMVIQQMDQMQAKKYHLKEHGAKLGRHTKNDILCIDEHVSRYHADIIFENDTYYLIDGGSQSGTFIRVNRKMKLEDGMIIEMGSNQFEFNIADSAVMEVYEGPNAGQSYELSPHKVYSIGRRDHLELPFPLDQHLSQLHSKVFQIQGVWYIEDMETTNGTWLRISRQGEESERFPLRNKAQFKVSSSYIYECTLPREKEQKTIQQEKCLICHKQERRAIFWDCRHVVSCMNCSCSVRECPVCDAPITKITEMFVS